MRCFCVAQESSGGSIRHDDLKVGPKLGDGTAGAVHRAWYKGGYVAVKYLGECKISDDDIVLLR